MSRIRYVPVLTISPAGPLMTIRKMPVISFAFFVIAADDSSFFPALIEPISEAMVSILIRTVWGPDRGPDDGAARQTLTLTISDLRFSRVGDDANMS